MKKTTNGNSTLTAKASESLATKEAEAVSKELKRGVVAFMLSKYSCKNILAQLAMTGNTLYTTRYRQFV